MRTRGISKDRRGKGFSARRQSSSIFSSDTDASDDGINFFVMINRRNMDIGAGCVSLKNKKVTSQAIRERVAGIAHGRK